MELHPLVDGWPAPHVAAVVVTPDGTWITGDPDRSFELASVTKVLTAMAVLVAVEEETLDLDEPAGPEGSTIRHLLAHASGLAPDERRSLAPPGTKRIYSNRGFEVLAEHLEARAGMPFAEYATEAVVGPLALDATRLGGSPAHGAASTVADLGRLVAELLRPALLAPTTIDVATTVQFPALDGVLPGFGSQAPNPWGLGVEIRGRKSPHWTGRANSEATFGHFGRAGTFLWVDPVARVGAAALTDLTFGDWAVEAWPRFSDAVLEVAGRAG